MSDLEDLLGRIRLISNNVNELVKINPDNADLAGWGQFLEANAPVPQTGPYGTAAGLLITQIAYPDAPIDERVCAQLRAFWEEKPQGKFFPQNVRLAFTVLALGKTNHPKLAALRNEIAIELSNRQRGDGSWSDGGAQVIGRPDVTAWAVLALRRAGGFAAYVENGAKWLANRVQGSGRIELLSLIGTAAAIVAHPNSASVPGLRNRGFELLERNSVSREEQICFFDFEVSRDGTNTSARDYLCFPAFYPLAILIDGLAKAASLVETVRLENFRAGAVKKLLDLCDGHVYKLPTAHYSSTVDQAIYALSYEHLTTTITSRTSTRLVPLYRWGEGSVIAQLFIPLIFVAIAAVIFKEPTALPEAFKPVFGDGPVTLVSSYKSDIQVCFALIIALGPRIPKKGWTLLRRRLLGQ